MLGTAGVNISVEAVIIFDTAFENSTGKVEALQMHVFLPHQWLAEF